MYKALLSFPYKVDRKISRWLKNAMAYLVGFRLSSEISLHLVPPNNPITRLTNRPTLTGKPLVGARNCSENHHPWKQSRSFLPDICLSSTSSPALKIAVKRCASQTPHPSLPPHNHRISYSHTYLPPTSSPALNIAVNVVRATMLTCISTPHPR